MSKIISIDPGHKKCGIVLVDKELREVIDGKIVSRKSVIGLINYWNKKFKIDLIILGNGTSSNYWKLEIEKESFIPIKLFEEKNTTLRSRYRYWELWPKNIFLRLIPSGLIIPPENLDAIAALLILEDYLKIKFSWPQKSNFKIWP
tara:strand:- start:558 stop:995 length:438 start_codon:yes stop_codon:yes gene_type:complete